MKQEHMDEIKSYYDKAGVFKKNDRYSEVSKAQSTQGQVTTLIGL